MKQPPAPKPNVKSDSFQRWFEGSKLADPQGNPIILYHGARPGVDITSFRSRHESDGIYFTPDPLYAEGFTNELFSDEQMAGPIYPVYLSIKNPFIVEADDGDDDWLSFVDRGLDRRELIKQGYDGAILVEKATGIIDQVQAYHPEQIKSAAGNVGTFDPTVSDIRYSRNDPRYMFAGPQAESSDLILLDKAREMDKKGQSGTLIYRDTGWFKGADGNWRFEISDHDAKLKIGIPPSVEDDALTRVYLHAEFEMDPDRNQVKAILNKNERNELATWGHTKEDAFKNLQQALIKQEYDGFLSVAQIKGQYMDLGDILDHPRLFAAYPRLRDMQIHFDPNMGELEKGEYDTAGGLIINANQSEGEILSIILHEVQHAIQQGEGLARGGAPEERFTSRVKSILQEMDTDYRQKVDAWLANNIFLVHESHTASDMLTFALMYESAQRLRSYANRDRPSGVLRLIKNEMGWAYHEKIRENPELRRPFDELDRNWMNLPKRHKMAARNLFLREQCAEAADLLTKAIPQEAINQFRNDTRQRKSMIKALEREASRAREKIKPLHDLQKAERVARRVNEKHSFSTAFQIYQALAGEIEARNTQTRQTMTPEERRGMHPERTADIPADEAIVLFRTRGGLKTEIPYRSASVKAPGYFRFPVPTHQRMSTEEVRYVCNSLMNGWAGKPPIEVVERLSELPVPLQKDIWKQRAAADVRAAFWNNTAFVVAPRMPDRNSLEEILLHEIVGHFGLRKMLEHELSPTLNQVYNDFGQSELAQEIRQAYFKGQSFQPANPEHRALVAEEMMAKLAESKEHRALTLWDRFDSQTREGLRRMGYQIRLTGTDLLHLLHGAERVVKHGGLSRPSEHDLRYRRAYHGSPHTFDKFSLEAIGTGEGGQAFGWGLYLAGNRAVAEYYQQALAREMGFTYGDHSNLSRDDLEALVREDHGNDFLDNLITPAGIASRAMDDAYHGTHYNHYPVGSERHAMYSKLWAAISWDSNAGNLYEVNIPDDPDFLDWDKPLSEQPPAVLSKLAPALELVRQHKALFAHTVDNQTMTGQTLYMLLRQIQNTPHEASGYLNSLGIPGLRYLDRFSRQGDSESHNYVVWDESVVSIAAVNEEIRQAHDEAMFRRAYHGTPYSFDRFSLEAIGTGEGALAFGYGLYFAGKKEVAEYYRRNVEPQNTLVKDDEAWDTTGLSKNAKDLLTLLPMEQAIASALVLQREVPGEYDGVAEQLTALRDQGQTDTSGKLYEVDIPDDDNLLDWDRPLTAQPETVQQALRRLPTETYRKITAKDVGGNPPTGSLIYNRLQAVFAGDRHNNVFFNAATYGAKEASQELNDVGIPGLRFLDHTARYATDGEILGVWQGEQAYMTDTGTGSWFARVKNQYGSKTSMPLSSREEAQAWAENAVRTESHNYVIWDDTRVTIEAVNEELRQASDPAMFKRAYHGTPHTIERFSMEAIGTGEGSQGYGYGLYFAEQRDVAEYYRTALASRTLQTNGGTYEAGELVQLFGKGTKEAQVIEMLAQGVSYDRMVRIYPTLTEAVGTLRGQVWPTTDQGNLYEVEIPDDDKLLDRDAPLSRQPEVIKTMLATIDFPLTDRDSYQSMVALGVDPFAGGVINEPTGADLQAALHRAADQQIESQSGAIWDLIKDDPNRLNYSLSQIASLYLNSVGIPGLRYRDAGSSLRNENGTSNYVIWDDAVVEIHAVNGEKVATSTEPREEFETWFGDSRVTNNRGEPQVVYHGSPYAFDAFSMNAIGTGEGAQVFGHGLYFASRKEVAEHYRDTVTPDIGANLINGWDITGASDEARALLRDMPMSDAIDYASARQGKLRGLYDGVDDELKEIRAKGKTQSNGYLYLAEVPDDDQLINGNELLEQQPEVVQNAISELLEQLRVARPYQTIDGGQRWMLTIGNQQTTHETKQDAWQTYMTSVDGRHLYLDLARALGDSDKAASELLLSKGIAGLRYQDRYSKQGRQVGEATYNYVIWDDQAINLKATHQDTNARARQTETPEFQAWFNGSKIVGENGEPLKLFHGTMTDIEFATQAGKPIYLTDSPAYANYYASGEQTGSPQSFDEKAPYPTGDLTAEQQSERIAELKAKAASFGIAEDDLEFYYGNLDAEDMSRVWKTLSAEEQASFAAREPSKTETINRYLDIQKRVAEVANTLSEYDLEMRRLDNPERIATPNVVPAYASIKNPYIVQDEQTIYQLGEDAEAIARLEAQGYDGAIWINPGFEKLGDGQRYRYGSEVLAFHPEQVKSAVGNSGQFNPESSDICYNRDLDGTPSSGNPHRSEDFDHAMNLLEQEDSETLICMLAEERGLSAESLDRENLVTVAYQQGMHIILNEHHNDLIRIAVKRWRDGRDSAGDAAQAIQHHLDKGAYGYDVHMIEPVLRASTLNANVAPSAQAANDADIVTAEERFRSFLYQELGYQEACLVMAEVAVGDNEVEMRQRRQHHKAEVEELRTCLSMLNAGMTVSEIRGQMERTALAERKQTPEPEGALLDLNQRLKLSRLQQAQGFSSPSTLNTGHGPAQE